MLRVLRLLASPVSLTALWLLVLVATTPVVAQAQETPPTPPPASTVKDPAEYNYLPLTIGSVGGDLRDSLIDGLVRDQGYEAKCANPQWKIKPQLYGEYEKYFKLFPNEVIIAKGVGDVYQIKLADAKVPMLRGSEAYDLSNKISSLEAFFGVSNPKQPADNVNSTGVIQNLTTLGQQCEIKMGNFEAIDKVCSKLMPGSKCFMDRVIPKTDMQILALYHTLLGLKDTYEAKMKTTNDQRAKQSQPPLPVNFCDEFSVTDRDNSNLFGIDKATHERFASAIFNSPLDIDTLYRIAFLVIAPTQNPDDGGEDIFWFLQHPERINDKFIKAPIIVAFRIPDFGTNKPLSLNPIKDSGQATRRILTPNDVLTLQDGADLSQRSSRGSKVTAAKDKSITNKGSLIYCPLLGQCLPPGNDTQKILYQTIIDIVNGIGTNCDGVGGYIEDAGDISTNTGLSHDQKDFFPAFFDNYLPQDAKQPFSWWLKIDKDHTDSSIFSKGYDNSVEVNAWIVAPLGTEMFHLEDALRAFFSQESYSAVLENNCLPDYPGTCGVFPERYPLKPNGQGPIAEFLASNESREFVDPDDPVICTTEKDDFGNKYEVCKPKYKQVVVTLVETKDPIGVRGAKVGWLLRKIQETVRPFDIQIECSRTEDLFLGKCRIRQLDSNAAAKNPIPSSLISCPMELAYKAEIAQAVTANKTKFLQEIKTAYPQTQMTGPMFDFVMQYSKDNGWNPALALALGREETAWGAVGSPHWLGCMAGDPGSISDPILHAKQQLDCVYLNFSTSMSCTNFMCKYGEGVDAQSCTFTLNPSFAKNLPGFYNAIVAPYQPPAQP